MGLCSDDVNFRVIFADIFFYFIATCYYHHVHPFRIVKVYKMHMHLVLSKYLTSNCLKHCHWLKGYTTQVVELAVVYGIESTIRIIITRSNQTAKRCRSYKMKCDLWGLMNGFFINFMVFTCQY